MERESVWRKAGRLSVAGLVATAIERAIGFVRRQKHNYRVAVTRSAATSFLLNLTAPYDSIYTVALGADSVELGTISSIGNGISALISAPVGWLVDRHGLKPFYLLGVGLLAGSALIYALAPSWQVIIAAIILLSISTRLTGTGCSVICADSVRNEDRATAQNLCVTVASSLSMVAPLIAAPLVTVFGGMTVEGIRPLYHVRFVGYGLISLYVAARLREPRQVRPAEAGADPGFVADFRRVFEGEAPLRRWLLVSSLTWFPMAMTSPFLQLFAHQVKGADQYVLGAMATAAVLARLLFGIPLGRLADRVGRKKVIYLLTPLWYASHLLLVAAFNSASLILAGALQTSYFIAAGLAGAMTLEFVPVERMGKWSGLVGLVRGLVTIPAPLIGGLIWKELGPIYVFLLPLAVDLSLKIPLLSSVPETLGTAAPSSRGTE
jgi:DHA1 family tetracycline resistance protein-like MFS transporter